MRRRNRTPYQEKDCWGQLSEARAAVRRLHDTLKVGDNRFGHYGNEVRASIARWEETIKRLEEECHAAGARAMSEEMCGPL